MSPFIQMHSAPIALNFGQQFCEFMYLLILEYDMMQIAFENVLFNMSWLNLRLLYEFEIG